MIGRSAREYKMIDSTTGQSYISTDNRKQIKHSTLVDINKKSTVEQVFTNTSYKVKSDYLLREIKIILFNRLGDRLIFERNKMSVSIDKFIGLRQDMFNIKMYNINLSALAIAINSGYTIVEVYLNNKAVTAGTIKNINTGRENIVENVIEINCLTQVTDLLNQMVSPITVNSSINIWSELLKIVPDMNAVTFPDSLALRDIKFDDNTTLRGTKKSVIEDMIKILNDKLGRMNIKDLPWIEYNFSPDNTLNIFGPYNINEVLNIQPFTGLTDAPTIGEDGVQFNSIYKERLHPGTVVKLNNKYFSTMGGETAFIYAWDPQGLYVITEVRYTLSNYPSQYICSCKARPLSKYNNFTANLGG